MMNGMMRITDDQVPEFQALGYTIHKFVDVAPPRAWDHQATKSRKGIRKNTTLRFNELPEGREPKGYLGDAYMAAWQVFTDEGTLTLPRQDLEKKMHKHMPHCKPHSMSGLVSQLKNTAGALEVIEPIA